MICHINRFAIKKDAPEDQLESLARPRAHSSLNLPADPHAAIAP